MQWSELRQDSLDRSMRHIDAITVPSQKKRFQRRHLDVGLKIKMRGGAGLRHSLSSIYKSSWNQNQDSLRIDEVPWMRDETSLPLNLHFDALIEYIILTMFWTIENLLRHTAALVKFALHSHKCTHFKFYLNYNFSPPQLKKCCEWHHFGRSLELLYPTCFSDSCR